MMKLDEIRILNLAIKVSEQLPLASSFCDDCMCEESCEYCEHRSLQNTLLSVMEELCCSNPFLLNNLDKFKMPDFWKEYCEDIIQKRIEYKTKHPND